MDYQILVLIHVVLLAYWLGGDFGVFYSSFAVCNKNLSPEARATAASILIAVDQLPRFCLVLILPVGLALAARLGAVTIPGPDGLVLIIGAAAWAMIVHAIHHYSGSALAKNLSRIDTVIRLLVIVGIGGLGLKSLSYGTPIALPWLAAKMLIFALIVSAGLCIRWVFKPFGAAFGELMKNGSSDRIENTISKAVGRSRPFVVFIWVALVCASWLGIAKPALT